MIRIGIVDLDSSHAPNFTQRINHVDIEEEQWVHGGKVVAACPGYSTAVADPEERNQKYTQALKDCGVEIVDSPEALLGNIDAVMIESDDGRRHLDAARPFLERSIPTFVDKPMACSLADAEAIADLAAKHGAPLCSGSSLRYAPEVVEITEGGSVGEVVAADVIAPSRTKIDGVPGMFHYGVHGVEMLYAFFGEGCEFVQCIETDFGLVASAKWRDGRLGTVRGYTQGMGGFGFRVVGQKGNAQCMVSERFIYRELLKRVLHTFETGEPPVAVREQVEVIAFAEAALRSVSDALSSTHSSTLSKAPGESRPSLD